MVKVKICGLKTPEAIEAAQEAGANMLGFIFAKNSPRYISTVDAATLNTYITVPKVAVVVDADDNLLDEIITKFKPDYIQLHGNETEERAAEIKSKYGVKLIKAIIGTQKFAANSLYDYLLLDSAGGGTGKQFDYSSFTAPEQSWILSGGLNAKNVLAAIAQTGAKFVDVSSGVESQRGVKDIGKIKEFLKTSKLL